ncbi:unnamed protein product, partial [Nesidiocoris tenuis]
MRRRRTRRRKEMMMREMMMRRRMGKMRRKRMMMMRSEDWEGEDKKYDEKQQRQPSPGLNRADGSTENVGGRLGRVQEGVQEFKKEFRSSRASSGVQEGVQEFKGEFRSSRRSSGVQEGVQEDRVIADHPRQLGFRGVVVITSALHAEGRQFDPGRNQNFCPGVVCFTKVYELVNRFGGQAIVSTKPTLSAATMTTKLYRVDCHRLVTRRLIPECLPKLIQSFTPLAASDASQRAKPPGRLQRKVGTHADVHNVASLPDGLRRTWNSRKFWEGMPPPGSGPAKNGQSPSASATNESEAETLGKKTEEKRSVTNRGKGMILRPGNLL